MAYFSEQLVQGVCIYPSWRKQRHNGKGNPKSDDRMGADRIVARCGMELYILGNLLWDHSDHREICAQRSVGTSPRTWCGIRIRSCLLCLAGCCFSHRRSEAPSLIWEPCLESGEQALQMRPDFII